MNTEKFEEFEEETAPVWTKLSLHSLTLIIRLSKFLVTGDTNHAFTAVILRMYKVTIAAQLLLLHILALKQKNYRNASSMIASDCSAN